MFRRLALAVALAAAAAGGCGKSAPAKQQVVPGAKAGVVLEVSGVVTATRPGAAARPLAKGDAVSGDDVVETGADGAVLIELDHNHVTFTLPAGKQQQVATSLAWTQPVAAARPTTTDENSAAAGRAIERSAVDTAASSADKGPPPKPTTGTVPADQPTPPAIEEAPKQEKGRVAPPGNAGAGASETDPVLDKKSGGGGGGGGDHEDDFQLTKDVKETAPLAASRTAPPPYALSVVATGDLTGDEFRAVVDIDDIRACFKSLPAKATIVITASGKAGRVTTGADAAATTCVRGVVESVTFPAKKNETTVVVDLSATG